MDMSRVETSLTRLEARLRAIIEGNAGLNSIPRKLHNQVFKQMILAMQKEMGKKQSSVDRDSQSHIAPDLYTIVLPTYQANILVNHPIALDSLVEKLESSVAQANLHLSGSPIIRIVPDPSLKELYILAEYSHTDVGDSYTTEVEGVPVLSQRSVDGMIPNAFLIVNGLSTYPLALPVINIGSDPTNQLVLKDPNVSPIHAQLRLSTGHFVIFNLDSRQGTIVNGMAVTSHMLNPGDVIRLAGVPLVYGHETSAPLGYTQELPSEPPALEVL